MTAAGNEPVGPKNGTSLHLTIMVATDQTQAWLKKFHSVFKFVTAEPDCTYFEIFQDS